MTLYEKIQEMSFDEMCTFILKQIHSECHGIYDEYCEEEGYENCYDCIYQMLSRKIS